MRRCSRSSRKRISSLMVPDRSRSPTALKPSPCGGFLAVCDVCCRQAQLIVPFSGLPLFHCIALLWPFAGVRQTAGGWRACRRKAVCGGDSHSRPVTSAPYVRGLQRSKRGPRLPLSGFSSGYSGQVVSAGGFFLTGGRTMRQALFGQCGPCLRGGSTGPLSPACARMPCVPFFAIRRFVI